MLTKYKSNSGFTLLELAISIALLTGTITMILVSSSTILLRQNRSIIESKASLIAQEGNELAYFLLSSNWDSISPGTYVLSKNLSDDTWELVSDSDPEVVAEDYQRQVQVNEVWRDVSLQFVPVGDDNGEPDPNILEVVTTVTVDTPFVSVPPVVNKSFVLNPKALTDAASVSYIPDAAPTPPPLSGSPDMVSLDIAYFAQEYLFHSSFDSRQAIDIPDVGQFEGTIGSYVSGYSFNGLSGLTLNQLADSNSGALEFWYLPQYDHDDDVTHKIYSMAVIPDDPNGLNWYLWKLDDNSLFSHYGTTITTNSNQGVTHGDYYGWDAGSMKYIRSYWNNPPDIDNKNIHTEINGINNHEINSSVGVIPSGGENNYSLVLYNDTGDNRFDELKIWGLASDPVRIASSDGLSDPTNYLANTYHNYGFEFAPVDANNRGAYIWLGNKSEFGKIDFNLEQAGVCSVAGECSFVWEFWSGITGQWEEIPSSSIISNFDWMATSGTLEIDTTELWYEHWALSNLKTPEQYYYIRGHMPNSSAGFSQQPIERLIGLSITDPGPTETVQKNFNAGTYQLDSGSDMEQIANGTDGPLDKDTNNIDLQFSQNESAIWLGLDQKFNRVDFELVTPASGNPLFTWQYWDGSEWKTLGTTGNNNFTTDDGFFNFLPPTDWKNDANVNGVSEHYFIKGELASATNVSFTERYIRAEIAIADSGYDVYQISQSSDDVTEDILPNSPDTHIFDIDSRVAWYGRANGESWLGLRYQGVSIPPGTTVNEARISFLSSDTQSFPINVEVMAEDNLSPETFSTTSRPSQRTTSGIRTTKVDEHYLWYANSWYHAVDVTPQIQDLVNSPGWSEIHDVVILIKGIDEQPLHNKYFYSWDQHPKMSPALIINY